MHACKHEIVGRCELAKKEMFFFFVTQFSNLYTVAGSQRTPSHARCA